MACRLMLGDCLERMSEIEAGSVDLVLADLPYGVTACKWDTVIPFEPLWAHYRRVLKPRGAVVLTASQPFTSMLVMSNREWFKYTLVWEKAAGTGFLNTNHQPLKSHEDIAVFSPAASTHSPRGSMTYNPQMRTDGEPWKRGGKTGNRKAHGMIFHTTPVVCERSQSSETRFPLSVIKMRSVNEAQQERAGHPTQKPVALMEYLIRTYTNEGETVLDNTMGSGTTGVACIDTDRNFIGIERDPGYFAIAEKRIAEAENATPLLTGAAV